MEIDRNYWKNKYKTEWKAGTSRVKHALDVLREKFPNLKIEPFIAPNINYDKSSHTCNISMWEAFIAFYILSTVITKGRGMK